MMSIVTMIAYESDTMVVFLMVLQMLDKLVPPKI